MALEFDPKKYWNERLSKHYDLIGVGDISLTMNYNIWSYKVTRKRLTKIFKKYLKARNDTVLDIGSGTGFVVDILQEFTCKINGIDISYAAVNNLNQKYPNYNFTELDAGVQALPFSDDSMSVVTAASVLYHIVDDHSLNHLLNHVHRVLKTGGYFIFSDNFIHNSTMNITHQKCRTLETYEELLRRNGFQIVDRVANYVLFNDPVDANGKLYPRIWNLITRLSRKWKWFDAIIWQLLYPLEIILTNLIKESPSQEIMICKAVK
jgi:ubiquinone/menaquinone biosynthesis C-methylase UbiE